MITPEERKYLVDAMSKLLSEYDYKHTEEALNKIVDRWEEQKAPLIAAFKKHPNYVEGQFMIASVDEYDRITDLDAIWRFSEWLTRKALTRTDLCPKNILARRGSCLYLPNDLWNFLNGLHRFAERCISEDTYNYLKDAIPEVHVHVGEKTSRVVGRICKYLNYDQIEGYEKAFAMYADALSPVKFKRTTVLSINPLDYLTMSFGNSWSSCHTIDKKNKREMPNSYEGMYSAGTMSYMLDPSSMVFYTGDDHYQGKEYWTQPKITRQMFHYEHAKLLQGRLYPQKNDSANNMYTLYRNKVRDIISIIFDFSGTWSEAKNNEFYRLYVNSQGVHYPDYWNFGQCNMICYGNIDSTKINIGSMPICVRCGQEHYFEGQIDHCIYKRCKHCGRLVNEEDAIIINGEAYCNRHVRTCAICGSVHPETETRYVSDEGVYVCEDCLREHFVRCDECHNYHRKSSIHVVDNRNLCSGCKRYLERRSYTFSDNYYYKASSDWNNLFDRIRFSFDDDDFRIIRRTNDETEDELE